MDEVYRCWEVIDVQVIAGAATETHFESSASCLLPASSRAMMLHLRRAFSCAIT
jgi:hypothetical protein